MEALSLSACILALLIGVSIIVTVRNPSRGE
jgi:hypothetical protein